MPPWTPGSLTCPPSAPAPSPPPAPTPSSCRAGCPANSAPSPAAGECHAQAPNSSLHAQTKGDICSTLSGAGTWEFFIFSGCTGCVRQCPFCQAASVCTALSAAVCVCRQSTTERMLSGQCLASQRLASQELPEQDPSEEQAEDEEAPPEQRRRSIGHPPTVPPPNVYRSVLNRIDCSHLCTSFSGHCSIHCPQAAQVIAAVGQSARGVF